MLIISGNSKKQNFFLSQLHILLGLVFKDDIFLGIDHFSPQIKGKKIIIKNKNNKAEQIEDDNSSTLYIYSDIYEMLERNFSMSKENHLSLDKHGRTIDSLSSYSRDPIIDEEILQIRKRISNFANKEGISFQEDIFPSKPIICLTHDVDSLKGRSVLRIINWFFLGIMKIKPIFYIKKSIRLFRDKKDYHDSILDCINIEEKYKFKSTFFFLSLSFFLSHEGRRYRLNKKKYKKQIKLLLDKGFEVGLHTSRRGFKSNRVFFREIHRLKKILRSENQLGVRNHYLAGSFPLIWKKYDSSNLLYDSSLGWSNKTGYRADTSNPFQPFNKDTNKSFEIYEIPLIIMDCAVDYDSSEEIFEECKFYLDKALRNKSIVTILWHTDRIIGSEYKYHSEAYRLILDYCFKNKFTSMTCSQIIREAEAHKSRIQANQICNES